MILFDRRRPNGRPASVYTFVEHHDRVEIVDCDFGATVTNDAEYVIDDLVRAGIDVDAKTVYYRDTEGRRDIIKTQGGKFAGFAPGG